MREGTDNIPTNDKDLSFETNQPREGVTAYVFNNVTVGIDRSGKNVQDFPELLFGVYEDDPASVSTDQPDNPIRGVDMEYISDCVKEALKNEGISEIWFYPSGDDGTDAERRKDARVRLFERYFDFEPGPNNYGYMIRL